MVSSEWGAPTTVNPGFKPDDVQAGQYGRRLHFWDWKARELTQTIDLGADGHIPLEVRFHHNPDSTQGFVGAALASSIWHWRQGRGERRQVAGAKIVQVEPIEVGGWPFPVPGLITRPGPFLDDRFFVFSELAARRHPPVRRFRTPPGPSLPPKCGSRWCSAKPGPPAHPWPKAGAAARRGRRMLAAQP